MNINIILKKLEKGELVSRVEVQDGPCIHSKESNEKDEGNKEGEMDKEGGGDEEGEEGDGDEEDKGNDVVEGSQGGDEEDKGKLNLGPSIL